MARTALVRRVVVPARASSAVTAMTWLRNSSRATVRVAAYVRV
jgi:hypothetical protein